MRISMMSFFRNYAIDENFEKALDIAKEVGCDGIEILEAYKYAEVVPDMQTALEYKKLLDKKGITLECYTVGASLIRPEDENYDSEGALQFVLKYVEIAKAMGARFFQHTLIGNAVYDKDTYVEDFDSILEKLLPFAYKIADVCNKLGMTVLYEPQGVYVNGKENFTKFYNAMKNAGKNVAVCGDMGNPFACDWRPEDFFDSFKHEIKHIHTKNLYIFPPNEEVQGAGVSKSGTKRLPSPLFEGSTDIRYCIKTMMDLGYDDCISLEGYYTDFLKEAPLEIKALKDIIKR